MRNLSFFFITLCLFFCGLAITQNVWAQGLRFDTSAYLNATPFVPPVTNGFATSDLPNKISYREYCPTPNNQGMEGTCVGWASAYGALSTQVNMRMGITGSRQKWARAFDPFFVYSFIKNLNDVGCKGGASIVDALTVLENFGCKPLVWEPWLNCNDKKTFNDFTLLLASQYKVDEWMAISHEDFVNNVKTALYYQHIVLIGASLTESFQGKLTQASGVWLPQSNERLLGGHAMCVIGYDNSKNGGSFEVLNSWGKEFGDNGFVWISYTDFVKFVREAYVMKTSAYKDDACSIGDCYESYSRYKFDDGTIYEGIVSKGKLDVYGSMLYTNGSFYVGGWKEGRKNGWGMLWDEASRKFYKTYYNEDVLVNSNEKSFGFTLTTVEKNQEAFLNQVLGSIPNEEIFNSEFEDMQKILSKYETPDLPMSISKR